ncbi:MAG: S8 family serine peptidase, partial [Saprospiraceae bacterium]|nr:S8 family serine peptidase [Saprospiraceae bacterium]
MRNQWYLIIWLLLPLGLSGQIDYNIQLKSGTIRQTEMLAPESVSESFIQHNRLGNFFYLVLQFNELPDEVMMQELNSLGIQLVGYLPHYAYLAKIPADTDFSALNVRRVIPFLPQHKLSEALAVGDYSDVKREGDIYYIKVVPFDDFTDFELADMLNNYGLGHATHSEAGVVVKIYRDQILRLAKHPAIQYVEGYSDQVLTEGLEGVGMQRLNFLHQGPGRGLDGTGVSVAIADDGTVSHPDLKGRLTTYTSNNLGDHGDMTVGLFAGAGNINPNGIGAAPGVNMHLYSINGYPHINNARDNYQKNRVTITSTSYGEVCGGIYNSTTSDIDGQVFGFPALLHVFSAGNSGRSSCANPYGAQSYNGSYFGNITGGMKAGKNVIAVGNVYFNDVLASSSSHGPTVDGRIKPDIVANGQGNFTIDGGTGYRSGGGTSAASPSLGGVAAGLYQAYRSLNGNEDPNSGLIKAILLNTAEDLGRPGPDYEFGWGRVHAGRALETIQSRQFLSGSVRNGNVATHTLQIPANVRRAKIMVYWVDPAAAPNAARALVNDLDMTVTLPTGGVSRPLVLSTVARLDSLLKPAYPGVDRVNNVEQVVLNQPGAGTYTVSVRGSAVAQGPQTYFVVYHYETQNLSLTYPRGGESLVAGEKTTLYWDAIGNTGSFTLEYATSTNGNWQMIAANIPVGQRYFEWNVPEGLSGNYFFRIRRNQEVSVSATAAHILKTPNFSITYGPNNQAVISWSAVNGADGYEVFALGNKYMEPIGQTSQTQFSFPATPWQGNWYSVRARHSSGVEGQRAHAKYYLHRPCEAEVQLTIQLDQYPDETSWQVRTPSGEVLLSGGPYPSSDRNKLLVIRECLPATCLEFVIRD